MGFVIGLCRCLNVWVFRFVVLGLCWVLSVSGFGSSAGFWVLMGCCGRVGCGFIIVCAGFSFVGFVWVLGLCGLSVWWVFIVLTLTLAGA